MPVFYIDRVISDHKSSNYFIVLKERGDDNKISYLVKESTAERIAVTLDTFDITYTSIHRMMHDFVIKNGWKFDSISLKHSDSNNLSCSMNLKKGRELYSSLLSIEDSFILSIIFSIDISIEKSLYERFNSSKDLIIDDNSKLLHKEPRLQTLNRIIERSIDEENYELAATIRDRIKKIK